MKLLSLIFFLVGMRWHYLFKLEIRMHCEFIPPIRTAGLEQEIESLKEKLTACTREKLNLQEELSEAYRIKASWLIYMLQRYQRIWKRRSRLNFSKVVFLLHLLNEIIQ
ncbi:uncharacterized protein LOC114313601 [Camellia sinensis]|uniref:uncharacterized protein LOC114313601 n=1 Tax=Camellia sinensis TaxID=4442 RepID=UPI00103679F6|nr:uncharacterized protein LOC114313601 [Camellia sinensis]